MARKGLLPTARTVYVSGGIRFADGIERTVQVQVGGKTFNVVANGVTSLRGTVTVTPEMPVMVYIGEINSPCAIVFDMYTMD